MGVQQVKYKTCPKLTIKHKWVVELVNLGVQQVVTRGVWSGIWAAHSNSKPVQNKKGCDTSKYRGGAEKKYTAAKHKLKEVQRLKKGGPAASRSSLVLPSPSRETPTPLVLEDYAAHHHAAITPPFTWPHATTLPFWASNRRRRVRRRGFLFSWFFAFLAVPIVKRKFLDQMALLCCFYAL